MIETELEANEIAFLDEMDQYVNKWVAILHYGSDRQSIVASGENIREARQKAESRGFKDVTFFRVPPSDTLFVPTGARMSET